MSTLSLKNIKKMSIIASVMQRSPSMKSLIKMQEGNNEKRMKIFWVCFPMQKHMKRKWKTENG